MLVCDLHCCRVRETAWERRAGYLFISRDQPGFRLHDIVNRCTDAGRDNVGADLSSCAPRFLDVAAV